MKYRQLGAALGLVAMLAGCGGGGGGSAPTPTPSPTPTPTVSPTPTACSLRTRQDWAAAQLREWYLFPETLPANLDPSPHSTVEAYIDALTATARGQGRDRYFTYLTSIAEENAYYQSGASAGFGFRLATDRVSRVAVIEAFEGSPALNAGIDRGTEILAIGTSVNNLRTIASIVASEGFDGVTNALGPDTAGTYRVLRVADTAGERTVTVTKSEFELLPVSPRYGAKIINDGGRRVGYVNLRTFISTADPTLRAAFANFKAEGVTEVIIDLRYNGGGLVSTSDLLGDLLGGDRSTADVFSYTTFRPEKSAEDEVRNFAPQPESIAATRIAFIGTGGTASASEMVINAFIPYLHDRVALIGANTYGKPVGQIGQDLAACDDRLRLVAFAAQNSTRSAAYFNGLASSMEATCQAEDDIYHPLGDPQEGMVRQALNFLAGQSCTPIAGASANARSSRAAPPERRELLMPAQPSTIQRELPGAF